MGSSLPDIPSEPSSVAFSQPEHQTWRHGHEAQSVSDTTVTCGGKRSASMQFEQQNNALSRSIAQRTEPSPSLSQPCTLCANPRSQDMSVSTCPQREQAGEQTTETAQSLARQSSKTVRMFESGFKHSVALIWSAWKGRWVIVVKYRAPNFGHKTYRVLVEFAIPLKMPDSFSQLPLGLLLDKTVMESFKNKIEKERKQPNVPDASASAQASAF